MSSRATWGLRVGALVALVLTLWLAGPRAVAVLASRTRAMSGAGSGPTVELGRVGVAATPEWLRGELLLAVMRDLEPRLEGVASLLDAAAARALVARLEASPWVESVRVRRRFPDRYLTRVELRRPELAVADDAGVAMLVDAAGVCVPAVAGVAVPRTVLRGRAAGAAAVAGRPHPDPRVAAAAAVAAEWRTEIARRCAPAPRLLEVDADNLGYRYIADGRYSEVRVVVARAGGGSVSLAYGHPPGSNAPRVPLADKARVLREILALRRGLAGLERGDLRFVNRWRDWLVPARPTGAAPR